MAGLIKWYLATKAWPSRVQYVLSYQRLRDMAIELGITRLNRPVPKHFKTIQASLLCILWRLEGGKKKARVGRWEGEREEPRPRGSRIFRLFYDRPPYDCYFSSLLLLALGYPAEASSEERGFGRLRWCHFSENFGENFPISGTGIFFAPKAGMGD